MNRTIKGGTYDEERAFYGSHDLVVENIALDGPQDGESAFKECKNIEAVDCFCNLRYPFWHVIGLNINGGEMTELCRAALWYCKNVHIDGMRMHGIKALRECKNVSMENCDVISPEFGWSVDKIDMKNTSVQSEYFMMRSKSLYFDNVTLKGKYSFQYIKDSVFENCNFDTKDAFWHAKNVVVKNSVVKGEYLAWYCKNVTFDHCKIIGTQPLCYCKNLKLINCEMIDCDLAFEKSEVEASVTSHVISIKNVKSGTVEVDSVGEIICDDKKKYLGKIVCHN